MTTITLNDKNPNVRRMEVRLYAATIALSQGAMALGRVGNPMALAKEIEDYVFRGFGEKQPEKAVVTEQAPVQQGDGEADEPTGDVIEVKDDPPAPTAVGPASLRQAKK